MRALTITALLFVVFFASYAGGVEMFTSWTPERARPRGSRDPNETHVPGVHSIRPIMHDPYGIPEHHFADRPRPPSSGDGPSGSEEQPDGGLLGDATGGAGGSGGSSGGSGGSSGGSGGSSGSGSGGSGGSGGSSGSGSGGSGGSSATGNSAVDGMLSRLRSIASDLASLSG